MLNELKFHRLFSIGAPSCVFQVPFDRRLSDLFLNAAGSKGTNRAGAAATFFENRAIASKRSRKISASIATSVSSI